MLKKSQFYDQVVLITGSSKGIGKELALRFANKKANLIINYSKSSLDALKTYRTIKKISSKSILIKADISKKNEVEKMFAKIKKTYGKIDILINNAGVVCEPSNFLKTSKKQWQKTIDTNLTGTYNCLITASKYFLDQKKGRILNISSLRSLYGATDVIAYAASKAGIDNLTKSFAKILSPDIMVNSLLLGRMNIGMSQTNDSSPKISKNIDDVFKQIESLVSTKNSVTGKIIIADKKK